jgi:DNA-binding transcriptional ArsR family regulator
MLATLDALISRTKQRVLVATLMQPERAWYLNELARHLGVTPSSIQRETALLVRAGILARRQDGNRVYYQADRACPILPDLSQVLLKTVVLVDPLKSALQSISDRINLAFIYGSIASSQERSDSDLDLMVIGAARLSEIAPLVRKVERQLGRSVNPTVYTTQEFSKKLRGGSHFLNTVLNAESLFVYGTEADLASLAQRPARETPPGEPAGVARPSGGD